MKTLTLSLYEHAMLRALLRTKAVGYRDRGFPQSAQDCEDVLAKLEAA